MPVGKKVRVIATAADVIHAWWIPALGAKQDAIPGFLRDIWFRAEQTGTFRGSAPSCAARSTRSCRSWCAWCRQRLFEVGRRAEKGARGRTPTTQPEQAWDLKELVARGEKVYAANCVACRQAQGQGTPAMKAPARRQQERHRPGRGASPDQCSERTPEYRDAGLQAAALRYRDCRR